jgi:Ca2+/H+ antiporter
MGFSLNFGGLQRGDMLLRHAGTDVYSVGLFTFIRTLVQTPVQTRIQRMRQPKSPQF